MLWEREQRKEGGGGRRGKTTAFPWPLVLCVCLFVKTSLVWGCITSFFFYLRGCCAFLKSYFFLFKGMLCVFKSYFFLFKGILCDLTLIEYTNLDEGAI